MVQTRLKVGGYEAWVVVEKEKVEHYEIEVDEEENVATCWIASTAGKKFGVWVVKRRCQFNCVVDMYLDGSSMGGSYLDKYDKEPTLMESVTVGEHSARPFLFGALNLTEDESGLDTQLYEDVGTIKIVVRHITNCKSRRRGPTRIRLRENIKIHERAKKSATHQVLFGEVQTRPKTTSRGRSVTYKTKETVATFIFHYRSLDMLMANGIAPCDPSPVEIVGPSQLVSRKRKSQVTEEEEEEPVVEISNTEDKEAKRKDEEDQKREQELEAELEEIRQARRERKHASKRVKCEPKVEPVFLPGEIIDLTV